MSAPPSTDELRAIVREVLADLLPPVTSAPGSTVARPARDAAVPGARTDGAGAGVPPPSAPAPGQAGTLPQASAPAGRAGGRPSTRRGR